MGYTLVSEDLKPLVSEDWTQAQPLNGLSKTHDMGHYITKKKTFTRKALVHSPSSVLYVWSVWPLLPPSRSQILLSVTSGSKPHSKGDSNPHGSLVKRSL